MARPNKQGIDYFSLDVVLDDKFELFEAEHGLEGFAFLIKLLQKIYESNGYYYLWEEDEKLLFSKKINVNINQVNVYINSAIKRNIFDKATFEKYNILTSKGIQKRFLEAVKRRKQIEVINEYILLDLKSENYKDFSSKIVNVNNNSINVNINSENVNDNTIKGVYNNSQSKVKESKVKEIETTTTIIDNNNSILSDESKKTESVVVVENEIEKDLVIDFYNKNIDNITDYSRLFIKYYRDKKVSDELIIYAMQIAVKQNKKTLKYIEGTLDNWEKADVTSVLEAKQSTEVYKKTRSKTAKKTAQKDYEQREYSESELNNLYTNMSSKTIKKQ